MGPNRIVMIRHGEKPADGHEGIEEDGTPDPESLMPRGWQRAGALVRLFTDAASGLVPSAIFAAGIGPESRSRRSIETVMPLVSKLRETADIPFIVTHLKTDHQALADDIAARGGTVLIAWEHKQLSAIATLVAPGSAAPEHWHDDRFDLLWVFDRNGAAWHFEQRPQLLLAGDRN